MDRICPRKNWAFNFVQTLSEIAKERPDLLVLVISVRNGGSDAYQQVHRVNPVAIDFEAGGSAERIQQDRRRMHLHRLADNRMQIANGTVEALLLRLAGLSVSPISGGTNRLEVVHE